MVSQLDTDAFHDRVQTLLTSAAGVEHVSKGHPGQWGHTVTVYSTVGGQAVDFRSYSGVLDRAARIFVEFGYRIADNAAVATCEQVLGDYLDSFLGLFFADLKTGFGGVATDLELDMSLNDTPEYWRMVGKEVRTYAVIVTGKQKQTW